MKKLYLLGLIFLSMLALVACKQKVSKTTYVAPEIKINDTFKHAKDRLRVTGKRGEGQRADDKALTLKDYEKFHFFLPYQEDFKIQDHLNELLVITVNNAPINITLDPQNYQVLDENFALDLSETVKKSMAFTKAIGQNLVQNSFDRYFVFSINFRQKRQGKLLPYKGVETLATNFSFANETFIEGEYQKVDSKIPNRLNKIYLDITIKNNKLTYKHISDDTIFRDYDLVLNNKADITPQALVKKYLQIIDNPPITNSQTKAQYLSDEEINTAITDKRLKVEAALNLTKLRQLQTITITYQSRYAEMKTLATKSLSVIVNDTQKKPRLVTNADLNLNNPYVTLKVSASIENALNNFKNALIFVDQYEGIIPLVGSDGKHPLDEYFAMLPKDRIAFSSPQTPQSYNLTGLSVKSLSNEQICDYSFTLTLVDSQAPNPEQISNFYTRPGQVVDYAKQIKFTDNIDKSDVTYIYKVKYLNYDQRDNNNNPTEVEKDAVDFNVLGAYRVGVQAQDKSGNLSSERYFLVCVTKRASIGLIIIIINSICLVGAGVIVGTLVPIFLKKHRRLRTPKQGEVNEA